MILKNRNILSKIRRSKITDYAALYKANSFDTEFKGSPAPFLDLDLSITNDIVSSKIYDKRDDFNFEIIIVYIPFLDGDVPRSPSYGVYNSQLNHFARVCSSTTETISRLLIY